MIIKVCVGSACHIKGSYEVIEDLKNFIDSNKLKEIIELKASFCMGMGRCGSGVSVSIDDDYHSVLPENTSVFIDENVKGNL